jgi:hypothetical protein
MRYLVIRRRTCPIGGSAEHLEDPAVRIGRRRASTNAEVRAPCRPGPERTLVANQDAARWGSPGGAQITLSPFTRPDRRSRGGGQCALAPGQRIGRDAAQVSHEIGPSSSRPPLEQVGRTGPVQRVRGMSAPGWPGARGPAACTGPRKMALGSTACSGAPADGATVGTDGASRELVAHRSRARKRRQISPHATGSSKARWPSEGGNGRLCWPISPQVMGRLPA